MIDGAYVLRPERVRERRGERAGAAAGIIRPLAAPHTGHHDQPGGELRPVAPDMVVIGVRCAQSAHPVRLSSMTA